MGYTLDDGLELVADLRTVEKRIADLLSRAAESETRDELQGHLESLQTTAAHLLRDAGFGVQMLKGGR